MQRGAVIAVLGLVGAACGGGTSTSAESTTSAMTAPGGPGVSIGPSGGVVEADDGSATLEIPAGALAVEQEISLTRDAVAPDEEGIVAWSLEPTGLVFESPVYFSVPAPGATPSRVPLVPAILVSGDVAELLTVGATTDRVSIPLHHFSRVILPGENEPVSGIASVAATRSVVGQSSSTVADVDEGRMTNPIGTRAFPELESVSLVFADPGISVTTSDDGSIDVECGNQDGTFRYAVDVTISADALSSGFGAVVSQIFVPQQTGQRYEFTVRIEVEAVCDPAPEETTTSPSSTSSTSTTLPAKEHDGEGEDPIDDCRRAFSDDDAPCDAGVDVINWTFDADGSSITIGFVIDGPVEPGDEARFDAELVVQGPDGAFGCGLTNLIDDVPGPDLRQKDFTLDGGSLPAGACSAESSFDGTKTTMTMTLDYGLLSGGDPDPATRVAGGTLWSPVDGGAGSADDLFNKHPGVDNSGSVAIGNLLGP